MGSGLSGLLFAATARVQFVSSAAAQRGAAGIRRAFVILVFCFALGACALSAASAQKGPGAVSVPDADIVSALNLDFPGMQKVEAAVARNDIPGAKQAYLQYRRQASAAKWTTMPTDMPASATESDDPAGDEVLRHHLHNSSADALPHEADMGQDFDWSYNSIPRNSPQFSQEWTFLISRTQFWEKLADAYWKTHDERYAQEWVGELIDFAVKNPRTMDGRGGKLPLWRSLDASIRMSDSWPYAYYHFLNSRSFSPDAQWVYLKMIREHGVVLEGSLQDTQRTGNWVSSECYGLFTLATLFPELKQSAHWQQFALDRIAVELNRMVPPDGFEAELTPTYHLVTVKEFLGPLQLANLNHISTPDNMQARIMSMYRAMIIVMAQNGDDVSTNDSNNTNAIGAAKQGLQLAYDPLLDWAVSGGKSGKGLPYSTALPYAGFYAMRSGWQPNDFFLFFRAGPTGIGHEHEDMLEVALKSYGSNLLIDPGTAHYDSSNWRRFIVGTESHNTITVDGKWQHRGPSKAPVTTQAANPWTTTPLFDYVAGTYTGGYQQNVYNPKKPYQPSDWVGEIDHSVTHTRRVLYLRPYYALLVDTIDGSGTHTIDSRFDVQAPSVRIDPGSQAAFSQNTNNVQIGLFPLERDHLTVDVIQGRHGADDINWDIPTVHFQKRQATPSVFATFLYPYRGAMPSFTSGPLVVKGAGVWGQTLHSSKEDAEVVLVKTGSAASLTFQSNLLGSIETTAGGLITRRPAGDQRVIIGAWGLTSFRGSTLQFTTDAPADLVVSLQAGHPIFFNGGLKPVRVTLQQPFAQTITLSPSSTVQVDASGGHALADASLLTMPAAN